MQCDMQAYRHKCLHSPPDPNNCVTCRIALSRNVSRLRIDRNRKEMAYGEIITIDHSAFRDSAIKKGVGEYDEILISKDIATGFITADPVRTKCEITTIKALNQTRGPDGVRMVYADKWTAFVSACEKLYISHRLAEPGEPQTN